MRNAGNLRSWGFSDKEVALTSEIRERKAYDRDLTAEQWAVLAPLLPREVGGGRHRTVDLREVLKAILDRLRTGCAWSLLPHDFPPTSTVYEYYGAWRDDGTWERMHAAMAAAVRMAAAKTQTGAAVLFFSHEGHEGARSHSAASQSSY